MPTTLKCRDREEELRTHLRTITPITGCIAFLVAAMLLTVSYAAGAKGNGQRISVKLTNNKAGKKTGGSMVVRPRGVSSIEGNGVVGGSFYLPKGGYIDAKALGKCKKSRLEKTGKCPKKALIATGSVKIKTTYEGMENLTASTRLYSGEKLGDLLMVFFEPRTEIRMVVDGSVIGARSKGYSYELKLVGFPVEPLGEGTGVYIYPSRLNMKIVGTGPYRNPRKCTGRGWRFGIQFEYEKDGASPIYSKRVRCRS